MTNSIYDVSELPWNWREEYFAGKSSRYWSVVSDTHSVRLTEAGRAELRRMRKLEGVAERIPPDGVDRKQAKYLAALEHLVGAAQSLLATMPMVESLEVNDLRIAVRAALRARP
jgi:hypothetical protein